MTDDDDDDDDNDDGDDNKCRNMCMRLRQRELILLESYKL